MKAQFAIPGIGVPRIVLEAGNKLVDIAVDNRLKEIAHQYGIAPVFVGIFGSRAKVYDGPESDYDLYVPYIGKIAQYVRAINVDTRQMEGEDILPPQITIEVMDGNKPINVQLNFVSFDHYIQELTRNNTDFRMALANILVTYWSPPVITVLKIASCTYVDLEKIKQMSLGRASKTAGMLTDGKNIRHSEVTDGLYRLLYGAVATTKAAHRYIYQNRTPSMAQLLDVYLTDVENDVQTRNTVEALLTTIRAGMWKTDNLDPVLVKAIVETIGRVSEVIRSRPIQIPEQFQYESGKASEARLTMAQQLNKMFTEMLVEIHDARKTT